MKLQDLAAARFSIPEIVPTRCSVDECPHPVVEIVTASFPDIAQRRVCLCSFHSAQLRALQAPTHTGGQWPEQVPTFGAGEKEPK